MPKRQIEMVHPGEHQKQYCRLLSVVVEDDRNGGRRVEMKQMLHKNNFKPTAENVKNMHSQNVRMQHCDIQTEWLKSVTTFQVKYHQLPESRILTSRCSSLNSHPPIYPQSRPQQSGLCTRIAFLGQVFVHLAEDMGMVGTQEASRVVVEALLDPTRCVRGRGGLLGY